MTALYQPQLKAHEVQRSTQWLCHTEDLRATKWIWHSKNGVLFCLMSYPLFSTLPSLLFLPSSSPSCVSFLKKESFYVIVGRCDKVVPTRLVFFVVHARRSSAAGSAYHRSSVSLYGRNSKRNDMRGRNKNTTYLLGIYNGRFTIAFTTGNGGSGLSRRIIVLRTAQPHSMQELVHATKTKVCDAFIR